MWFWVSGTENKALVVPSIPPEVSVMKLNVSSSLSSQLFDSKGVCVVERKR